MSQFSLPHTSAPYDTTGLTITLKSFHIISSGIDTLLAFFRRENIALHAF